MGTLDHDGLRRRLRDTCPPPGFKGAGVGGGVPAAVLVGLLAHEDGPRVILTQRTPHLRNHPSQISLPGGRVEEADRDLEAAALRETFEEIGVAPDRVEVLGCLAPYLTVSGFCVYPFVGWIEGPVEFVIDPYEVSSVFQVPLAFVLDPRNRVREAKVFGETQYEYWVIPFPGRRIWGATAGILVGFAEAVASGE